MNPKYLHIKSSSHPARPLYFALDLCAPTCTSSLPHDTTYNIGLTSSATVNGASVFDLTSSTVTPSASSMSVKPFVKSTSNTHYAESLLSLRLHRLEE